jgi:hypothetical protein
LGTNNVGTWIDDLYICDGAGPTHNTFLGDVYVQSDFPVSNNNNTNWDIVGAGTAHEAVGNYNTASFIGSDAATADIRFNYDDVIGVPGVLGAGGWVLAKQNGPHCCNIEAGVYVTNTGQETELADVYVTPESTLFNSVSAFGPNGFQWTPEQFDLAEVYIRKTSGL